MAEGKGPDRTTAGILAILLGGWGVHKFYMGNTTTALIHILLCCGGLNIIGIIEGIIYLTKTDDEFHQLYVVEKKQWF